MNNLIYALLNPFTYYIFTRVFFPLYYLFTIYFSSLEDNSLYTYILFSLLILIYPVSKIFLKVFKITNEFNLGKIPEQSSRDKLYIFLTFIYAFFVIFFLGKEIPLFNEGGSNSIVNLNEQSRFASLLLAGLILPRLACATLYFRNPKNYIWLISLIGLSLISGKKGAFLQIIWSLILGAYFYRKKIIIGLKKLILFIGLGFTYIVYVFFQTSKLPLIGSKFGDGLLITLYNLTTSIIYYASNVHLIQIFEWGGDKYFSNYSGEVTIYDYFLNPILKFLNYGGVEKTLGTYITSNIFDTEFPLGAAMTLSIEGYAVGGLLLGIFTTIISLFLLAIIYFKIGKKGINHISFSSNSILLTYLPFIITDPLNGYKNFFFVFLIHLIIRILVFLYFKE